jgi:hypothetical protein
VQHVLIGFALTFVLATGPALGAVWCAVAARKPQTGVDFWSAVLMGSFLAVVAGSVLYLGVSFTLA